MRNNIIDWVMIFAITFSTNSVVFARGRIQGADVKSQNDIQTAYGTITGNLTATNVCISSPSSTTGLYAGQYIYDQTTSANIASGTTIVGIPGTCSAGQIQMSIAAAGNGTGDSISFGGPLSAMIQDNQIWSTAVTPNQALSSAITTGAIGGGGGSKNYLTTYNGNTGNGDFEQGTTNGWALGHISALTNGLPTGTPTFGSGAAGTLSIATVTGGSQLSKTYSLNYVSSAATTVGDMVCSSAFTIDASDQAKVLGLSMNYKAASGAANMNFSGSSSNSYGLAVYDVTNSAFIPTVGAFNIVQGSGVGKATATVQTGATTASMRVCLYNVSATAGAATLTVDDFVIGPQVTVNAPAMSDWTTTTTTIIGSTTNPTKGTVSADVFSYKRVGDSLEIYVDYVQTAAGSAGSGIYLFTLPNGLSIDSSKIPTGVPSNAGVFGTGGTTAGNGTNAVQFPAFVVPYDSTHIALSYLNAIGTIASVGSAAQNLAQTNVTYSFRAIVPIAGWSSNSVSSADTDTRVIAARSNATPTSSAFNNTVYLIYGAVLYDTSSSYSTTTGLYTAPVSGIYNFSGQSGITASSAGGYLDFVVYKNGTATQSFEPNSGLISGEQFVSFNYDVQLNAGDTVGFRWNTDKTSPAVSGGASKNTLNIKRLSGPAVVQATESVNAFYSSSAGQSIANGSTQTVVFGAKVYDSHNAMNSATGVYTCPVSGKYRASANIRYANNATWTAGSYAAAGVSIGYTNDIAIQATNASLATGPTAAFSQTINCVAGSSFSITTSHGESSARNLVAAGSLVWVAIERVGN